MTVTEMNKYAIYGFLSPSNSCPVTREFPAEVEKRKGRRAGDDLGGRLLITSPMMDEDFNFHLSMFGPHFPDDAIYRVVMADPVDGCAAKGYKVSPRGKFVVVTRGVCGFSDKVGR